MICFACSHYVVVARAAFAMSKSISLKPVGNRGEHEVKLSDPTGPLTEELPPSVISVAN